MTSNPDQLSEADKALIERTFNPVVLRAWTTNYCTRPTSAAELARLLAAARVEGEGSSRGLGQQPCADAQERSPAKFYVASRASVPERGQMWRRWRSNGVPITSTWIDEDGEGQTTCNRELWGRIEREVREADALVLYVEADDFPLKGALVEVGMAIALGRPVFVVAPDVALQPKSLRPLGSWAMHPLVRFAGSVSAAFADGAARATSDEPSKYSGTSPDTSLPIPQGWKLVPVEPTKKMHTAAWKACENDMKPGADWAPFNTRLYAAMLAASPQPSKGESIDE